MTIEFPKSRRVTIAARLSLFAGALLLPCALVAQEDEPPKFVRALGWDADTQGKFVTSIAIDPQNNVWVGTEWNGLWEYDSRKKAWSHYTTDEGLGGDPAHIGLGDDNVYAVAVDKLGRVWVGHLNHGVSVFNGEKWKNYDLLDGPLGSRVFAIATCPTDGDVWIATDCGVARYSLAKDDWDYFTIASGLPSNQAQAIAFDSKGNIFLGTQCDGIAMASAADNYKKWTVVAGPPIMPQTGTGYGLPSSLINSITVTDGDKLILAGTPQGIGMSADDGKSWKFMRGQNWQATVAGLYPVPADTNIPAPADPPTGQNDLLIENWVTCMRQDPATKNIWIGYQKKGVEVRGGGLDKSLSNAGADAWRFYVRDIALPSKGMPLLAVADSTAGGLKTLDKASGGELEPGAEPPKDFPSLPSPAKAPDAGTLGALAKRLDIFKNELKPGEGVFLGDDWRTQGNWVGRYGNSHALLSSLKEAIFEGEPGYEVDFSLGPHNKGGDPENFVSQLKAPTTRVLYNPITSLRTEAEVNDLSSRKKIYPYYWQGPDLWINVKVPAGLHRVSLYFLNNDEQTTWRDFSDKLRDYDLQLLPYGEDPDAVQKSAPMARTRVADFAGGVYKRFVVAGPGRFIFRAGRNHSFGTKLQGVFIDRLDSDAPDSPKSVAGFDAVDYSPPKSPDDPGNDARLSAAMNLWQALDKSYGKAGADSLQFQLRVIALRAAVAAHAPPALLANWRWKLAIWTKEDMDGFKKAAADAFKDYSAKHPAPPPQQENPDDVGEGM